MANSKNTPDEKKKAKLRRKRGIWVLNTDKKITQAETNRVIAQIRRERLLLAMGPGYSRRKNNGKGKARED